MIIGRFDIAKRPYVECRLFIPRLRINSRLRFLLDTGSDDTCLHPRDASEAVIPFNLLRNRTMSHGIGGSSPYFHELAELAFPNASETTFYCYRVNLQIAEPSETNTGLPSLLGRDVFNHWYMRFDPPNLRLDFEVRHADYIVEVE
jgi:hypothetical protein